MSTLISIGNDKFNLRHYHSTLYLTYKVILPRGCAFDVEDHILSDVQVRRCDVGVEQILVQRGRGLWHRGELTSRLIVSETIILVATLR
jgi:hypothetical protein